MSDPHLRDLRYFVVAAEELHFTHAAERLGIAQPTLSRQIRHLEEQIGVTLFDRNQRTVALTVAGRSLADGARRVLTLWDEVANELISAGGTLRLGLAPTVRGDFVADLEEATGQRLESHVAGWSDPTCGLATRESDLALLWLPVEDGDRYRWQVLRTEPRFVVFPEAHPLAKLDRISFGDLIDEPFIALPDAGPARDFWLGNDARGGRKALVASEVVTPEDRIEEIAMGRGVCLIAEENVPLYRWPGIVARTVTDLDPCELALVWRADEERAVVLEMLERLVPRA